MKNKNLNLTRKNVKAVFGEPNQEKNGEMIYGCQLCKEEGHDTDNDHLKINVEKGCITCFANEEHSKFYRKMYSEYVAKTKNRRSTENLEKDSEAISIGRLAMKNNEQAREILKSYGYNDSTIDRMPICLFDGWFGISMYNTKNEFLGFEFRDDEKYKFSHKTKGYADDIKNTLCVVYPAKEKKNIFVMAGFKDAHIMYQYLNENGRLDDNYIATASNGEPNTSRALQANREFLKDFDRIILCLDRDMTGRASTKKVAAELGIPVYELKLPYIENKERKAFKDFTDWYCLAKQENFDESIFDYIGMIPESLLLLHIKPDDDFDKRKSVNYLEGLQSGIYPTRYGYYRVNHSIKRTGGSEIKASTLKRETNFTFKVTREVISANNKFDVEKRHKLEVQTVLNGKLTKPMILSPDMITKPESIMENLDKNGIHFSCLNGDDLKSVLEKEVRICKKILYEFENPGIATVKGKQYWLYTNACIDIEGGETICPEKDETLKQGIIKIDEDTEIVLNPKKGMKAPVLPDESLLDINDDKYRYLKETAKAYKDIYKEDVKVINVLASSVIRNTLEAYNNSPEPFFIIGNAIMSPFVDTVYKDLKAFPVSYGYGEARSGKSNILELIANIFGYGPDYISGGNDTSNNLMHNMEYYSKTPVLFAEIETNLRKRFQENVKSIYDRVPRKLMKGYGEEQNIKAINGTVHFATNDMLPKNEQTMTRLIFAEFKQGNFNYKKAIPFNAIRDDLIGLILPELLFYLNSPELIQKIIQKNTLIIDELESKSSTMGIDTRSKKNLAVAMTGIDLLFEISNIDIEKADDNIKKFKENQIEFLKSYAKMIETKDHFITFMEILTQLFKQEKLIAGQEYKFIKGGIAVYLKSIMPAFREMLKRTSEFDEYIPDEKEIKHASQKYGCTPDYNVNFNNKTRRTLLIPPHVEGMDYIMSILLQQNDDDNNAGTVI